MKKRLRSLLGRHQRALLLGGLGLAGFMLANTLYLLFGRVAEAAGRAFSGSGETLPWFFQGMVLAHTGVGVVLAVLMGAFFVWHLPTVWIRSASRNVGSGVLLLLISATLLVTGLFIVTAAASRANRWAWWLHVTCAAAVPIAYVLHRMVSAAPPERARIMGFGRAVFAAAGLLVVVHVATGGLPARGGSSDLIAGGAGAAASPPSSERPFDPGFVSPTHGFFPSPASTVSGGRTPLEVFVPELDEELERRASREARSTGFVSETPLGAETCVRCHAEVVEQWSQSAHRFASFNNPFYEATIDDMRGRGPSNPWVERHLLETSGSTSPARVKSRWCGACHDPALMLTGVFDGAVDRTSVAAQAGLTCLACHAIETIQDRTGNGNYRLDDVADDPYVFADAAPGTPGGYLHDAALRSKPGAHRRRMLKPFFSESLFCGTCHKVSLRPPLNGYRWLRGQNEFDAWHDSGVSRNAARTFYLPEEARVCQDCHMPPEPAPEDPAAEDGMVRSHRFVAANTALPWVRGDTDALARTEAFLREDKLRVDVFALRRRGNRPEGDPVMALDASSPRVAPGERVVVDVVVRNLGVGHTFPGGTNDSNEGWLEVSLLDSEGNVLAVSGALEPSGEVDPLAHAYLAVLLDEDGRRIERRDADRIHVTAASNVIGPGTADIGHYEFAVPPGSSGPLRVRARLLWRKFNRAYTRFAFETNPEGFARFAEVPDLPVTEIAADEVSLQVVSPASGDAPGPGDETGAAPVDDPAVPAWVRYNDYGIGLLLEGNTRLATRAFEEVEARAPERVDGALNLARAALAGGDLQSAYGHLERAEAIRPRDARVAWTWGSVLYEDGRYEQAAAAYRRVLEDFPDDRQAWQNLGRSHYRLGRFEPALEAFGRVLAIDPEDRGAHYFRMLTLRAAGRLEEAEVAEAAFQTFAVDEAAQALTLDYRRQNPGVNLMAQPVHTHTLEPAGSSRPGAGGALGAGPG